MLFWRWNGVGGLCVLRATTEKKVVNFVEEKSASGWPGWRMFWPRNDLVPLLCWRRPWFHSFIHCHCSHSTLLNNCATYWRQSTHTNRSENDQFYQLNLPAEQYQVKTNGSSGKSGSYDLDALMIIGLASSVTKLYATYMYVNHATTSVYDSCRLHSLLTIQKVNAVLKSLKPVWNDLPPTLRASPGTLRQFQSTLKTILFCSACGTWSDASVAV